MRIAGRRRKLATCDLRLATARSSHPRLVPAFFLLPALGFYALLVLWPLLETGWLSLQQWDGYGPQTFVGLRNFADLFQDAAFQTALLHSVRWELAAAFIPTAIGLGLALLARAGRVRGMVSATLLVPVLLPATVVASVWVLVYSPLSGLLNTALRDLGLGNLARGWLGDP